MEKRVDKNKELYKKLVIDEIMLIKIRHSLAELREYYNLSSTDYDEAVIHWDRYNSNWTFEESHERQFVAQCFWVNNNVSAIDVLKALEIVKESKDD